MAAEFSSPYGCPDSVVNYSHFLDPQGGLTESPLHLYFGLALLSWLPYHRPDRERLQQGLGYLLVRIALAVREIERSPLEAAIDLE